MKITKMYRLVVPFLLALFVLPGITHMLVTHATSTPYKVELAASNFGQNLFASAVDLSNPGRALFSLQNGTPFWYALSLQSSPAGMQLTPADSTDLLTTTFYGTIPLLPASNVLPASYIGQQHAAALRLAVAFTGPGEQVQLTLNPFDSHAALMDIVSLLLHLFGERADGVQVGLLAPNVLKTIFDDATSMRYLQSLASDYAALLQSVPGGSTNLLQPAYVCASDLVGLVADPTERQLLADILWLAMGKTVARASIVATLSGFGQAQFGLGILGYLKDEAQLAGGAIFQQNNPTLLLQSIPNVASTHTP